MDNAEHKIKSRFKSKKRLKKNVIPRKNPTIAKSFQDEIHNSGLFEIISFEGTHRVPVSILKKVYKAL